MSAIDPELLGRLAAGLEDAGRGIKSLERYQVQLQAEMASLSAKLDSAHARLKQVETKLDGNGGNKGLRTDFELLKKELESSNKDLSALEKWRNDLDERKLKSLETEQRDSKTQGRTTVLTIAAIVIALGSMLATCGPQWVGAWSPSQNRGGAGGSP